MAACFNTVGRETTWDGNVHVPCNMTAVEAGGHSTCCAIGDLCLTNGLCMHKGDVDKKNWYWRTGCTDKSWEDPACPKYCAAIGEPMQPFSIRVCRLTLTEPTRNTGLVMNCLKPESWCCAYVGGSLQDWKSQAPINTTCCTIDDLKFEADDPIVYATATNPIKLSTQSASISTTSTSLSSISMPTTATQADQSSLPTAGGNLQQSSDPEGLSTGAKIGLGVGIPLGVIGLAAIVAFFWMRRRRAAKASSDAPPAVSASNVNHNGDMSPYHQTAMKQQEATIYRHEAPSPQVAHELPASAAAPFELPQTKSDR